MFITSKVLNQTYFAIFENVMEPRQSVKGELNAFPKSIVSCQPAQANMGRNFSAPVRIMHFKGHRPLDA